MPYTTVPIGALADLFTEVCGPVRTELHPTWHHSEANGYHATAKICHLKIDTLARLTQDQSTTQKPEPTLVLFGQLLGNPEGSLYPVPPLFPDKVDDFTWAGHTIRGTDLYWKVLGLQLSTSANRAFVSALCFMELIDFTYLQSASSGERWAIKDMGLVRGHINQDTFIPTSIVFDWTAADVEAIEGRGSLSEQCNVLVQTGKRHEWIYFTLDNNITYWADFTGTQFDRFYYRDNTHAPYMLGQPNSEKFSGFCADSIFSVSRNGTSSYYPASDSPSPALDTPVVENLTMIFSALLMKCLGAKPTSVGAKHLAKFMGGMQPQTQSPL